MTTIIVAVILIGSVVAICLLLITIHNKHKREAMNNLLNYFSQLGTEYNLNFSSQEILKNCMLGLDGMHRKVLVVTREESFFNSFIIDLKQVKNCTLKKIYGSIGGGDLKNQKLDHYLEKIVLHFELSGKPSVEIVFYQHFDNHIYEALELEQKARDWETILSKMQTPLKNIA